MQKLKATLALVLSSAVIGGCSWFSDDNPDRLSFPGVYKIDVQQGNIITQEMVDRLRPGMTREQVRFVMGEPVLPDTFNSDRWDYVYSYQTGDGTLTRKRLSLFFNNDLFVRLEGDKHLGGDDSATEKASAAQLDTENQS